MYVNPGELNKRIEIITIGEKDSDGFRTGKPNVITKPWAKYSRKTSEKESGGAGAASVTSSTVRFLIRYTSISLNTNMKVRYNGRYYDIQDVNDVQDRHEYIEIICKEGRYEPKSDI